MPPGADANAVGNTEEAGATEFEAVGAGQKE